VGNEGNLTLSSFINRGYAEDLYLSIADNFPTDQLG
jgi:hypothetical protein